MPTEKICAKLSSSSLHHSEETCQYYELKIHYKKKPNGITSHCQPFPFTFFINTLSWHGDLCYFSTCGSTGLQHYQKTTDDYTYNLYNPLQKSMDLISFTNYTYCTFHKCVKNL
jgi:hypothetical protein